MNQRSIIRILAMYLIFFGIFLSTSGLPQAYYGSPYSGYELLDAFGGLNQPFGDSSFNVFGPQNSLFWWPHIPELSSLFYYELGEPCIYYPYTYNNSWNQPSTGWGIYSRLYNPLITGILYGQRWGIPTGWNNDYSTLIGSLSPEKYLLYQGYSYYHNYISNYLYLIGRSSPYMGYNPILEPLNPIEQYIGKSNQMWYDSLPDEWKPQVTYDEAGNPIFTYPETPWGYGIPGWGTLPGF